MKIATIVGARPQFIKAAVVSECMRNISMSSDISEIIVHTGQHYDYDLSKIFFEDLNLPKANYNLNVGSGSHAEQLSETLLKLEKVLKKERPDMVLVYGDANSTLAGSLSAVKLCLPIAHVEAGARNFSLRIPEEVNRVITDRISAVLFCSSQNCVKNLEKERIRDGVFFTGDVMYDLHLRMRDKVQNDLSIFKNLKIKPGEYFLGTVHRPRNTDDSVRLKDIFMTFLELDKPIVLPLHPRTIKNLMKTDLYEKLVESSHIRLIKPLRYLELLRLLLHACGLFTDSGGMQKEAYFCQCPCITLFHNTSWPETLENGWNRLVDSDKNKILEASNQEIPKEHPRADLFGNGNAGDLIVERILNYHENPRDIYI